MEVVLSCKTKTESKIKTETKIKTENKSGIDG